MKAERTKAKRVFEGKEVQEAEQAHLETAYAEAT